MQKGISASSGFIAKHGLWTDEQQRLARDLPKRIEQDKIKLIRIAWADPHGVSRAKTVTAPAFLGALESGYNINVATTTLDASGARTFSSFTRGGGMDLDEMTGSPNLIAVPDPATFRVLPWASDIGWVLCDEYFVSGVPFHFSPRHLLRKQLRRLEERGLDCLIGLEIEWYLLRVTGEQLSADNIGEPGRRGVPIATAPIEPGFSFHSESNFDLMQAPLSLLADTYERLGLSLRSLENEWGPGQVECTFAPCRALEAADNMLLFRTATRQVARRMGYFATFMARPAIKGYYSSGWHLHQSLVEKATNRNAFMPTDEGEVLSPLGMHYLGGLLKHAVASTVFAVPTVNGYRRFRPNSLAPDRLAWGIDHRGTLLRVLGAADDPATRIENRIGEPSANPYLYIASQIVTGLAGVDAALDPGPPDTDPYVTAHDMLPTSLAAALDALESEPLYGQDLGAVFMDYYLKLKRTELGRFTAFCEAKGIAPGEEPTEWEQNEYFDFF